MKFFRKLTASLAAGVCFALAAAAFSPGVNVLTGSSEPATFDDGVLPATITTASIVANPFGDGYVVKADHRSVDWPFVTINVGGIDCDRPLHISYKGRKTIEEGGVNNGAMWIMKNGAQAWQIAKNIGGFAGNTADWLVFDEVVSTFGSLVNSSTGEVDRSTVNSILLETQAGTNSRDITEFYYDDISIIPAHKITYRGADGVIRTDYRFLAAGTGFCPELTAADEEAYICGWATVNGGDAASSVEVGTTDITLYAVYDNSVRLSAVCTPSLLTAAGKTAHISTSLSLRGESLSGSAAFTLVSGNVTLTDNGDGTATVTSTGEGIAIIRASFGDSVKDVLIASDYSTEAPVPDRIDLPLTLSRALYDHVNSYYDDETQSTVFVKSKDVPRPNSNPVTYYTNGFFDIRSLNVDLDTHPYLVITLRCADATSFQLPFQTKEKSGTYQYPSQPSFPASDDFVTYSLYMPDLCSTWTGTLNIQCIGTMKYTPIYVKEVYYSNIPAEDAEGVKKLVLYAEDDAISADGGTLALHAAVTSSTADADTNILWSVSDPTVANLSSVRGGSVTITPVKNGEVTVTATSAEHPSLSESMTVTITGQRQKLPVYEFRILFWGSSSTKHPPAPGIGWTGNWGMAASSEDKDYVHRFLYYLKEAYPNASVDYEIVSGATLDSSINNDTDATVDYSTHAMTLAVKNAAKQLKPNLVIVSQTGNMSSSANADSAFNAYSAVYDGLFEEVPDAVVLMQTCLLSHNGVAEGMMTRLSDRYGDKAFEWRHWMHQSERQYYATEWAEIHAGIANHTGDLGMDLNAQEFFAAASNYIGSVIKPADYLYLPESITVSGGDEITVKGGTLTLSAAVSPADAATDVIWSSDNENAATVDAGGVVTAVNNGSATIRAAGKYNEEVYGEKVVTVTGQGDTYQLTYAPGTTDAVTGLPDAKANLKGTVELSAARPLRDYYVFAGWGLAPDSGEAVTSVEMTDNVTVYALWEAVESYEFDGDYDEAFGYLYGFTIENGFHNAVEGGYLTTVCTEGMPVTFRSPALNKNAAVLLFSLSSAYVKSGSTLVVTTQYTDSDKTTTVFPLSGTAETVYAVKLNASKTLSGFSILVNSAKENDMFPVNLNYVRFEDEAMLDGGAALCLASGGMTLHCDASVGASYDADGRLANVSMRSDAGAVSVVIDEDKPMGKFFFFADDLPLRPAEMPIVIALVVRSPEVDTDVDVSQLAG